MDIKQVTKKKRKSLLIGIFAAVVLTVGIIVIIIFITLFISASPKRKLQQQLDLGEKYITELDYDNAIVAYQKAIEIAPNSVEAYLRLANAYVSTGDYTSAIKILRDGYAITQNIELKIKIDELVSLNITLSSEPDSAQNEFEEELLNSNNDKDAINDIVVVNLLDAQVGDYVLFGMYEQDNDTSNGLEPIEWEVLDVQDGRALLISRYVLEVEPYNDEYIDITWENCSLRKWLNNDFYKIAFDSLDQNKVQDTYVINDDNPYSGTEGGDDTTDKVFCLSIDEIMTYYDFGSKGGDGEDCENLVTEPTPYAENKGVATETITDAGIYAYSADVVGKTGSNWWLRTPSTYANTTCVVHANGNAGYGSYCAVYLDYVGIRPALWVSIE